MSGWNRFSPVCQPDLALDYFWRINGEVILVHREVEAKYRALYGFKTSGLWCYEIWPK